MISHSLLFLMLSVLAVFSTASPFEIPYSRALIDAKTSKAGHISPRNGVCVQDAPVHVDGHAAPKNACWNLWNELRSFRNRNFIDIGNNGKCYNDPKNVTETCCVQWQGGIDPSKLYSYVGTINEMESASGLATVSGKYKTACLDNHPATICVGDGTYPCPNEYSPTRKRGLALDTGPVNEDVFRDTLDPSKTIARRVENMENEAEKGRKPKKPKPTPTPCPTDMPPECLPNNKADRKSCNELLDYFKKNPDEQRGGPKEFRFSAPGNAKKYGMNVCTIWFPRDTVYLTNKSFIPYLQSILDTCKGDFFRAGIRKAAYGDECASIWIDNGWGFNSW